MGKYSPLLNKHPVRTLLIIFLALLVLTDLLFGLIVIPRQTDSFRCKDPRYHHGLKPMTEGRTTWNGRKYYSFFTNSLGFRDGACRIVPLKTKKHRILFMGDSHTEGVGMTFEESFTGKLATIIDTSGFEILNAGVVGYSPKLYYFKTKYLLDEIHLDFDELFVFLDISDIQNELVYEHYFPSQNTTFKSFCCNFQEVFLKHSSTAYLLSNFFENQRRRSFYDKRGVLAENPATDLYYSFFDRFGDDELIQNEAFHTIGSWYLDKKIFDRWGRKGLILEKWYMAKLAALCHENHILMTISIHPWPIQMAAGDWNSIQVQFWEKFARDYQTGFINFFEVLYHEQQQCNAVEKYYLERDVHFNESGHQLIAEKLASYIATADR